jgi:ubiquitin-associated SH3 domain-containing protein
MNKFALYACPTGDLAEQIQSFLASSQALCGPNLAHESLPYCTLVDLFEERASSVPVYTQSLDRAYKRGLRSRPSPVLSIEGLQQTADRLELALAAPWLRQLIVNFACTVKSPTRKLPLRLQDHLCIILAHGYPEDQAPALTQLAKETLNLDSPSHWEMRFYQRTIDQSWISHQSWELGVGSKNADKENG